MKKLFYFLLLMLSILFINPAGAKDAKMNVDNLPIDPIFNPNTPIGEDKYAEQQSSFLKATNQYLNGKYEILDQRIFVYAKASPDLHPQWVVVSADIGNFFYDQHGKFVNQELDVQGIAAISIFKIGLINPQYFALVMSNFLPDGNALVAYLELKKE